MTMDQRLEGSVAFRRYPMLLLLVFASVALVLAGVAIYGVISYSVSQRTREIGIRMALGASQGGILRMVIRQGMTLVLGGVAIGLGASLAVGKLLSSLLFGINPSDPITIVGISLLLAAVAFLACYVPARRATDINPMAALRYE